MAMADGFTMFLNIYWPFHSISYGEVISIDQLC